MGIKPLKCTIVSGAPVENYSFLKENVDLSSFIIAADSGYVTCRKAGIPVNLIIGDFDSSPKPTADCEIITLPCEKDDTDTFSCIKEAIKRGFDEIAIFCAAGSRLDHTYSNIVCLDYCNRSNINAYIVNENNKAFISSKDITLKKDNYKFFSVFAFSDCVEGLTIKGAKYEIENKTVYSYQSFGQSNEFLNDEVKISLKKGTILLFLSND